MSRCQAEARAEKTEH